MIETKPIYDGMFNSAARQFVGRIELLEGSTLLDIFEHDGALISFTVDRTSDNGKLFGYGISQILTVKLRDTYRSINVKKGQYLQAAYGIGTDYVYNCTMFVVDEVSRDETTNEITIKALDPIYSARTHLVKELTLPEEFTLKTFAYACGSILGMPVNFVNIPDNLLNVTYTREQVNFNGEETIRVALDNLAEMFGSIYYFCNNWNVTFKRLDVAGEPVLTIDKTKYFELTAKTAITLANLSSITELGDNVSTTSGVPGETYFIRENAFLALRPDIAILLENILSATQGLTAQQFSCKHRGDFRLEIGDKVSYVTKDDSTIETYVLTDSLTYNGGLVGKSSWEYAADREETASNPTSLGDALKKTYAAVDKVNGTITLYAEQIDEIEESVANLKVDAKEIAASVSTTQETLDGMGDTIDSISKEVSAKMTSEEVEIAIKESLTDGVNQVTTSTGFTFNQDGLTVSKSNSEMKTQITEDGMTIYRDDTVMLTADHKGVTARDLHATTYLIVGGRSRFENYESDRVGCFWMGGSN